MSSTNQQIPNWVQERIREVEQKGLLELNLSDQQTQGRKNKMRELISRMERVRKASRISRISSKEKTISFNINDGVCKINI